MNGAPNIIAYLALAICPLVSLVIMAMFRAPIACGIIILGGQMFMPPMVAFDAPLIPPLNKDLVVPISALIACLIMRPRSLRGARPGRGYDLLILLQIIGYFGTFMTNRDPVHFGPRVLQGHTFHDVVSGAVQSILYWFPPFFLGRALYRDPKDLRALLVMLAAAGLIYAPFLLLEMRMSPQLNRWIYGFHQTEFAQTLRGGGFRPKAFMRHGLNVALFMVFTVLAAAALAKIKRRVLGLRPGVALIILVVMVLLCRSAGAITYMAVFLPLIWFAKVRRQARWAAVLALLMFLYPVCRTFGLVPIESMNHFFLSVFGEERAGSLAYRLTQEGLVMQRALQRLMFGWGGYDRPFPHDPYTGNPLFAIDGLWVIEIGTRGVVGFIAIFGLLLLPAWRARRTLAKLRGPEWRRERIMVGCLAVMTVVYVADLIPNSSLDPYLTFLVGALVGTERGFDRTLPALALDRPQIVDRVRIGGVGRSATA